MEKIQLFFNKNRREVVTAVLLSALAISLISGVYSLIRIHQLSSELASYENVTVGLAQGNLPVIDTDQGKKALWQIVITKISELSKPASASSVPAASIDPFHL